MELQYYSPSECPRANVQLFVSKPKCVSRTRRRAMEWHRIAGGEYKIVYQANIIESSVYH